MKLNKVIEDSYRIRMFKLFYKELSNLPPDERFANALVKSSSLKLKITPEMKPLIKKWFYTFSRRSHRINCKEAAQNE